MRNYDEIAKNFTATFHPDMEDRDLFGSSWLARFALSYQSDPSRFMTILQELRDLNAAEYPDDVLIRIWDASHTGWSFPSGLRQFFYAAQAAFETVYVILKEKGKVE